MTTPSITINATVHIHVGDTGALRTIIEQNGTIIMSLADLAAAVAENTQVDQSAITLLEGLADKIDALGIDNAELDQLTAELRSSSASLAAGVTANTPADTATEPDPGDAATDGTATAGADTGLSPDPTDVDTSADNPVDEATNGDTAEVVADGHPTVDDVTADQAAHSGDAVPNE